MSNRKSPINGVELPLGKPFEQGEEQRERARRAGIASGIARRKKKTLRDELQTLLAQQRDAGGGKKKTVQEAITASLVKQALEGNTKAYEIIRDTIGQKPADAVIVNAPDSGIMDEIRKRIGQMHEP